MSNTRVSGTYAKPEVRMSSKANFWLQLQVLGNPYFGNHGAFCRVI
jgi:hypothetical protein